MMLSKKLLLGLALTLAPAAAFAHPVGYPPPGQPVSTGRYVWRTDNQWVPGGYQQVWVPGRCFTRRWRSVCRAGFYGQRWVPGHYQPVSHWVWVPAPQPWLNPNPGPVPPRPDYDRDQDRDDDDAPNGYDNGYYSRENGRYLNQNS